MPRSGNVKKVCDFLVRERTNARFQTVKELAKKSGIPAGTFSGTISILTRAINTPIDKELMAPKTYGYRISADWVGNGEALMRVYSAANRKVKADRHDEMTSEVLNREQLQSASEQGLRYHCQKILKGYVRVTGDRITSRHIAKAKYPMLMYIACRMEAERDAQLRWSKKLEAVKTSQVRNVTQNGKGIFPTIEQMDQRLTELEGVIYGR